MFVLILYRYFKTWNENSLNVQVQSYSIVLAISSLKKIAAAASLEHKPFIYVCKKSISLW